MIWYAIVSNPTRFGTFNSEKSAITAAKKHSKINGGIAAEIRAQSQWSNSYDVIAVVKNGKVVK